MFGDVEYALRKNLRGDREYAEEYAQSFLNAYIATQIKVIREQRKMTQAELGALIGTTQAGISRYEDVNYSSWSLRTLMRLARAFDVRLRVSFDPYGTLPDEVVRFDRERLQVVERENDPMLGSGEQTKRSYDSGNVTDIGAFRAIAGIEPPKPMLGGKRYGTDRRREGAGTNDDRTRRLVESGENPISGLHSAIGGAL